MATKQSEIIQGTEKEFLDIFKTLCYSRNAWQVWTDLISAMACSLSNATDRTPGRYEQREKEYEQCIKRLGSVDVPSKLMAIVVMALEKNPEQDFLGKIFMNLNLGNHWKGQFFTPYSICKMMSEMTCADFDKQIEDKGYISVCDQACGAGATLIAAANTMKNAKYNFQNHVLFVGQDIDRVAGMMCYIQLSLLGCAGYVCIANTLTNPIVGDVLFQQEKENQEFWYTPMFQSQVWTFRRLFHSLSLQSGTETTLKTVEKEHFYIFFDFTEQEAILMDKEKKKQFISGVEKLRFEEEQLLSNISKQYQNMARQQYDMVFSVLFKKCEEDTEFNELVLQEGKNWGRCMKYCSKKAMEICNPTDKQKELARKGEVPIAAPVTSDVLFRWIDEYYRLDDKAEIEKEKKEQEKAEKKRAAEKKKAKVEKKKEPNTTIKSKKSSKSTIQEGQMSLFDLLG